MTISPGAQGLAICSVYGVVDTNMAEKRQVMGESKEGSDRVAPNPLPAGDAKMAKEETAALPAQARGRVMAGEGADIGAKDYVDFVGDAAFASGK